MKNWHRWLSGVVCAALGVVVGLFLADLAHRRYMGLSFFALWLLAVAFGAFLIAWERRR